MKNIHFDMQSDAMFTLKAEKTFQFSRFSLSTHNLHYTYYIQYVSVQHLGLKYT